MDVAHIAKLANLKLSPEETSKFAGQFAETLKTVDLMSELDTGSVPATAQVGGLENVTRPDVVIPEAVLTQAQALSQAKQTHQGYFVVPGVLNAE